MTHVPHGLADDFADHLNTVATLRAVDPHFARLTEEYHAVNRRVHRAETHLDPVSDLAEIELRKTRASLKDQIWRLIRDAEGQLTS